MGDHVAVAVLIDGEGGAAMSPAAGAYRNGKGGGVTANGFHVEAEETFASAEALRTYADFVNGVGKDVREFGNLGIGIVASDLAEKSFLERWVAVVIHPPIPTPMARGGHAFSRGR